MIRKSSIVSKYIMLFAGLYMLINLIQAYLTPLIDDEAYYWAWSQKLAWGYFDHPPMIALWIKIGFSIFQNELGVRLVSVFAGGFAYIALANLLEIKTKEQVLLYTAMYYSMVLFAVFGFIATPDSPLLFFGILYFYFLRNFLKNTTWVNSAILGLIMSLLLYSKYHGILLIVFSLLPLVPKLIKQPKFYFAVLFGASLYIPHLLWQYNNDFISVNYHIIRRNVTYSFKVNNTTDYILNIIGVSSPLLFWHYGKAIIKLNYKTDFQKSLIWSFYGILVFFMMITLKRYIQAQWSLLAFIPLIIIGFSYYKNRLNSYKWIFILASITFVLMFFARIYFVKQDVPWKIRYHGWKTMMKKAGEVTDGEAVFEKYQWTSLYNFYNYPNKVARNYITLENRHSQYQIWDSENKLNGKNITFFSPWGSGDSILLESQKTGYFYYKKVKNFTSTSNLELHFDYHELKNDTINLKGTITNNGSFPLNITPEKGYNLRQVFVEHQYSTGADCAKDIKFLPFKLQAKEKINIELKVPLCELKRGEYFYYFGFIQNELPIKRQSNLIPIKISK